MGDYILSFRVHGPSQFNEPGEIGEARIRPMSNQSGVTATIDFEVEADDPQHASKLAKEEYQDRARTILDVLSFVVEDGLVLGNHYDPIPADANIQQRMDSSTTIGGLVINIGDGILESADPTLDENPRTRRALSWYNLGLSTETHEDRFIAFWTGLEAAVESQSGLSDKEDQLYEDAVEAVEDVLSDHPEFRGRVKSVLGMVQREDTVTSLKRVLISEASYDEEDLTDLRDLNNARADIVHHGKQVEEAADKANRARRLLMDLLDARLSHTYEELLEGTTKLPDEREQSYHSVIDAEEWLQIVFDDEEDKTLSTQEIQRQAYALLQDIHEVARLGRILPKLSGWDEPLHHAGENEFQYSPPPEWVTPKVDAILQYLNGAGWVTPEVISYNLPDIRSDVNSVDETAVAKECEDLIDLGLIEKSGDYYKISLDGEMCLDGRLDPKEITKSQD